VAFLDDVATRARLQELLEEEDAIDREALAVQERLLTALRAIPAGTDLEELQLALLEDSVAGFYVSDTGELVVRVPDDGRIRGIDRITIAHELQHALADQALGLPDPTEPPLSEDADATLATLAVVEGDATLVMQRWGLEHVSLMEQLGAFGDPDMLAAQAALDDVPHVLQRELMSPYLDGLDWVCDRYLEGGWAAVDEAYRSPPTTTAEVLFGEPVDPVEPTSLGAPRGFDEVGAITFGAAPLLWLFEAPGDDVSTGRWTTRRRGRWRGAAGSRRCGRAATTPRSGWRWPTAAARARQGCARPWARSSRRPTRTGGSCPRRPAACGVGPTGRRCCDARWTTSCSASGRTWSAQPPSRRARHQGRSSASDGRRRTGAVHAGLVTGARGKVGVAAVAELQRGGHEVTASDLGHADLRGVLTG
jgi:hypothetical protein